ncbi:hypothetical protein [Dyadobacter fermentans]|uniref:hypothetical protein n=1 Tax=Dyadobacter fermentans TaxID=94254 RepID=UPI001CC0F04C|nr:hypothetical protein [Dyadobacter fermentans]MBZ1361994.1 hypothetical protein [Dyadobacter fermentans]
MDSTIEAGQTWRMRNGKPKFIDELMRDNRPTPVRSGEEYWQTNGRYWSNEQQHSKDLIEQVK